MVGRLFVRMVGRLFVTIIGRLFVRMVGRLLVRMVGGMAKERNDFEGSCEEGVIVFACAGMFCEGVLWLCRMAIMVV